MTDTPTPVPAADGNLPKLYEPSAGIRWGLWEVATGLLVFLMLLAGSYIFAVTTFEDVVEANADLVNFAASIVAFGGLLTVVIVASRRLGLRSLAEDFGLRFRPVDLAIGLGIGIGGRIFTVLLTGVVISITGYTPPRGNFELSTEPLWFALNSVLIAVLVGPFVEELFFRGLFLRAVRHTVLRWRRREQPADAATQRRAVILSIGVSSVVFMALHLLQADSPTLGIILGVSTLTVGIVNAAVALRTNRLGGAIVGHMVFNGSAVLIAALVAQG